MPKIHQTRFLV